MPQKRLEGLGPNPSGLCQCNCGGKTAIAKLSNSKWGHVKGTPVRYIRGHHGRGRAKCNAVGCDRDVASRGLCSMHLQRGNQAAAESRRRWQKKNPDYARKWYLANEKEVKARARAHQIRTRYGLSVEEYERIVARGCSICGASEGRIYLDHCHVTGNIRDALCQGCNSGLGMMGDDPERLRRAANYLEEHATRALARSVGSSP